MEDSYIKSDNNPLENFGGTIKPIDQDPRLIIDQQVIKGGDKTGFLGERILDYREEDPDGFKELWERAEKTFNTRLTLETREVTQGRDAGSIFISIKADKELNSEEKNKIYTALTPPHVKKGTLV